MIIGSFGEILMIETLKVFKFFTDIDIEKINISTRKKYKQFKNNTCK